MNGSTATGTLSVEVHVDSRLLPEPVTSPATALSTTNKAASPTAATAAAATAISPISALIPSTSRTKTASFFIPLPVNVFSPVCELKRHIALRTSIPPHLQRLSLLGSVDNFRFPSSVLVTRRTRTESYTITVSTYNELNVSQRWQLRVDPTDTVLDVKFLLQPLCKADAEYQHIYVWRKGDRSRHDAANHQTLMQAGIAAGSELRLLFEYPSLQAGHGNIHRSEPHLVKFNDERECTMGHIWKIYSQRYATRRFLGTRTFKPDGSRGPYQWQTFGDVAKRVTAFGSGLLALGLRKGECVGIISVNRAEWTITDVSCATHSLVSVPLYDTLGPDAVRYIINHANVRAVVTARANLQSVVSAKAHCPSLQYIILMDDDAVDKQFVSGGGSGYTHTMSSVEQLGQSHPAPEQLPSPSELFSLCYTSGTTGQPKGAVLLHSNMASATASCNTRFTPELLTDHETVLSYLPMAHIYERAVDWGSVMRGQGLGFYQGDNTKIVEDVAELKPTVLPGVPRVWQRMYDRISAQVAESGFIRRTLFERALAAKQDQFAHGSNEPSLWDRLVFRNVAAKFGGQLKLAVSGAAPISPTVAEYVRLTFQAPIAEGYGLTETCATLTLAPLEALTYGRSVGIPLPCNEVKLVDVPDMAYHSTDLPRPRGEIWVRGFNVFSGYYKLPDVTAECLTDDGWFMTGDVGEWQDDGSLRIIDRKKNLFKLAQGEYIRPEHIEGVYKQSKFIGSIYVHGDSLHSYLIAIIVPNPDAYGGRAKSELIKDKRVERDILRSMDEVGRAEGLKGFEVVKRVLLVDEEFTVENGLLTPTMKVKRHAVGKRYEREIKELYDKGEEKVKQTAERIRAKL